MVVLTKNASGWTRLTSLRTKLQIQYRVLDLIAAGRDSRHGVVKDVYRVRVFEVREVAGKEEDVLISTAFPKINNEFLDEIPFRFIGIDNVDADVDEPPLIDLVDMNLSHYRSSADYEHGCHFTGLPTPVISGHTPETTEEGKLRSSTLAL
jgi:hypothetical protein